MKFKYKVGEYLRNGKLEEPRFYPLLKTNKIPTEINDPVEWLDQNVFPPRGIICGQGAHTERLSAGRKDLTGFFPYRH